jgi:hypothetical protein
MAASDIDIILSDGRCRCSNMRQVDDLLVLGRPIVVYAGDGAMRNTCCNKVVMEHCRVKCKMK